MTMNRRAVLQGTAVTAVAGALTVAVPGVSEAATRPLIRQGSRGTHVKFLQTKLRSAGYWTRRTDGYYDDTTQQAVMALQKMRGLTRDGVCGPKTWAAVNTIYRPAARTKSGSCIEINLKRQVIITVVNGRVQWVFNTSTGNNKPYRTASGTSIATTPKGVFRIERGINGMRISSLGQLWRPRYWYRGWAVHGSPFIPGYPASHGCARVSNSAINYIWWKNVMPIGRKVWIY
ncbi:L,D-transpeptidase family protein [Kribbia dieselivorans]|uniref:L,D-transpeptidase family protein n=1 Tax=Kribbia dieselivorans TaxID=331526 RepID=UPI000837F20D|nr:L,D-transpeptidase family protein [Kribbia dieselivorans]